MSPLWRQGDEGTSSDGEERLVRWWNLMDVAGSNLPENRHLIDGLVVRLIRSLGDEIKSHRGVGQLAGCVAIPAYRQALDGIVPNYTFRTSPEASNNLTRYSLTIPSRFETDSMTA